MLFLRFIVILHSRASKLTLNGAFNSIYKYQAHTDTHKHTDTECALPRSHAQSLNWRDKALIVCVYSQIRFYPILSSAMRFSARVFHLRSWGQCRMFTERNEQNCSVYLRAVNTGIWLCTCDWFYQLQLLSASCWAEARGHIVALQKIRI